MNLEKFELKSLFIKSLL